MIRSIILTGFLIIPSTILAQAQQYDLVIKNGRVVDGTGNPWYYADVAIQNGKVARIGTIPATEGKRVIDAKNQIVAPGFIDVHAHVEGSLEERPTADNFLYDGVTSVVTGNCGGSRTNLRAFQDTLKALGISINVASLVGHNAIRLKVMKTAFREPTAREQAEMEALVEQAMKDGAVGLSTGLIYTPGTYARTPEIVNLAKAAARYGGVYASHIRNEGQEVSKAIEEAIQIGREAGIAVQISHFKVASKPLWGFSKQTISMVDAARREGIDVTVDQYPYTASSTTLLSTIPSWALADSDSIVLTRFHDAATRLRIKKEMLESLRKNGRNNFDYAVVSYNPVDTTYNGLSITRINQKLGRKANAETEADLILDLIEKAGPKRIQMVYHTMSEEDVATIMRYPNTMVASDAGVARYMSGVPHPRAYGTNSRVLGRYVREKQIIPLEEAIRRMTSLPAQRFRLADRGLLKPGYAADIVVFDEKTVADQATYDKPHAYATGFSEVLVNGEAVIENSRHSGKRPGQVLVGNGYQAGIAANK
ncbi:N-acyl-D-amino-acid deacylase family protein [Nibrella viscosa]